MSNKLITDSFPKVKKQRVIKENFKTTKDKKTIISAKDAFVSDENEEEENLQLLREFDLNLDYGPCIGITRLERWERAEKFGLHPPQTVKDLVLKNSNDDTYTECIWNAEKL